MNKIIVTKTRTDLADELSGIGAEIGVEQGEFSEIICSNKKVKKLYSIDAWKAYSGYRDHTRQKKLDNFFEISKKRLSSYNCEIIRKFSEEAIDDFMDESLDFVYIDANHDYDHVTKDLELWYKKVKVGGIVAGHDYIRRKNQKKYYDVVSAVDDFVAKNKIENLYIYKSDSPASWKFIKTNKL